MKLETIITLASKPVELMFRAMERSLRATGCGLPIQVIPFSDERFTLPDNAFWWEVPEFLSWIDRAGSRPVMRKYQALLAENYQFVDTDIVFLRDPAEVLAKHSGLVTCCGHWHNPGETLTEQAQTIYRARSTVWQAKVFNTGQFACDRALYDLMGLKTIAEDARYRETILDNRFHEQPGIVLLAHLSGVGITNLTLPPNAMESTWAGDYPAEFEHYWKDPQRKPYLIHWAGTKMDPERPISELFHAWLTPEERDLFESRQLTMRAGKIRLQGLPRRLARRVRAAAHAFLNC